MAYQPPHLRAKAQPNARPAPTGSRNGATVTAPAIQGREKSRQANTYGAQNQNRPPFNPRLGPSSSSTSLQSPAGDMKPSRRLKEVILDPMELLQSVSRSGGDGAEGDALKDYDMQQRFRIYIDERIDKHYKIFTTARHTAPEPGRQEEIESLSSIVLLFRKLREGVVASSRIDDFAIEVFESSARLAILARHTSQLMSSLSGLVPGLYHAVDDTDKSKGKAKATAVDDLVGSLSDLTVGNASQDNRAQFASILLLLQLVQSESTSTAAFHSTLLQLTSPPPKRLHPKFDSTPTTRQTRSLLPPTTLAYALEASRALSVERFDPIKYFRLLTDERASSYERIVLSWAEGNVRDRAWEVMKRAYISMGLDWACRWTGEEGDGWVVKKGATCVDGVVRLR